MVFSTTVSVQIIKKLWDGAPDNLSVLGTLLIVAITGSPITARGRELASWLLRALHIKRTVQAQAMATMAALALILVLGVQIFVLPHLAEHYNTKGLEVLKAKDLTMAKQYFQRAVAIEPDYAVGYYHVAKVYGDIGQYDSAVQWYEKSIEADLDFPLAYIDLANIKIQNGAYQDAIDLLTIASIKSHEDTQSPDKEVVEYAILINLGWAYFEKGDRQTASNYLENAVAVESMMAPEFRSARLYYLLAKISEENGQPEIARVYWEDVLKYIDPTDARQTAWKIEALQKVEE
jgi:tetratricopeptide (TPR) repeat protein